MNRYLLVLLAVAALSLAACGSKCDATTCNGCCDASGACQSASNSHCGLGGGACQACSGAQTCQQGICAFPGGNGAGGGSGTTSSTSTASSTGSTGSTTSSGTASTTSGTSSTSSSTTSTSGTTGTTTTSSTTTSGTSSSGSTGVCTNETIAQARVAPLYQEICLSQVTTVYAVSPGPVPNDGGGTAYNGDYYVADSNGDAMLIFKSHYSPATGDPLRGEVADFDGIVKALPGDAGPTATIELSGNALSITNVTNSFLPTSKNVSFGDLDKDSPNAALIGSYVMVPAGSYTQNFSEPLMKYQTYQDGLSLSDGTHTVLVDTYDFFKSSGHDKTCLPTDGGVPDMRAGGFKAIFDYWRTPSDGVQRPILIFGDCSDL